VPVTPEVGAATVASPAGVLELDTHSSSKANPSESSPPLVSVAHMVSPFMCLDDLDSDTKIPERHVSPTPHDAMLTRSSSSHLSSDDSSSGHSSSGHSLSRHTPPDTTDADSSTPPRFVHPPLARTLHLDSSSESFVGPSHKRCRSPAVTMISSIYATRALVPSCADLLPPHKRFRDFISPEDSVEEDIDKDVLEEIKAEATAIEVAIDRDVKAEVDTCIDMEVDVGVDVEDEVEDEVESSDRGTIEVGVDVVVGMISLMVASLERSNARLQGTMMMERARADRFQRHVRFIESELRQICRFRYYDMIRFRRLENFAVRRLEHDYHSFWLSRLKAKAKMVATTIMEMVEILNSGNGNGNPNENNRDASNFPEKYQVKYATYTLLNSALTWWNSHQRTVRTDAVFTMSWRELVTPPNWVTTKYGTGACYFIDQ
nr:hypothetical protein [Tanacetum cinerariifolium]